mgnify:CR=1 FL=1
MRLHILLVDSDPEETLFHQDVLAEIQEGQYWPDYIEIACIHAPTWSDAESILSSSLPTEKVDLILLSLDLEDAQGPEGSRRARAAAPEIPLILIVDEDETDIALQQIREGAQDFLVVGQVDCAPLAQAMRTAMERQRVVNALRSAVFVDELTGLPNAAAFYASAERNRKLAERLGCRFLLLLAEPHYEGTHPAAALSHSADLRVMEAADKLRELTGPADLLARISDHRFAVALLGTPAEPVEAAWSRMHRAAAEHHFFIGTAIMDPELPTTLDSLLDQAARDLDAEKTARGNPQPRPHAKYAAMRT